MSNTSTKPIHEHQDGRGTSVRYANQTIKRRKARRIAEKMMGKNYFTNMQEVMLQAAIEISKQKEKNEKYSEWRDISPKLKPYRAQSQGR